VHIVNQELLQTLMSFCVYCKVIDDRNGDVCKSYHGTGTIIHTAVHLTYGKSATTDTDRDTAVSGVI